MTNKRPTSRGGALTQIAQTKARHEAVDALVEVTARDVRSPRGKDKPITSEMLEDALLMLEDGVRMDVACERLGLHNGSLTSYGSRHPEFGAQLREAMALGTINIVNNTFRVARGEEGFSTGSIERDKLLCDMSWRYAKTIGNRIFGDKLQVDQRTVTINLPGWMKDL